MSPSLWCPFRLLQAFWVPTRQPDQRILGTVRPWIYSRRFQLPLLKYGSLYYLMQQDVKQAVSESISSKMDRDLYYRISTLQACDLEEIFSSELTRIVNDTLQALREQTGRVFELSRFECRTVKEISEELSISPKGVEYHITRSLKVLRVALKDYLPVFYLLFLR